VTVPTFLVAGAGRSGTTGLVEGLRAHPKVFVTQPKEPHYFALHGRPARFAGPGDDATINRVAVTDRQGYLNLYPSEHGYAALGDGSVSTLFYYEHSIEEILAVNPDMRIILLLRDPVARAYSAYLYMRARGFEPCSEFEDAIADEPRRRREGWHHLWLYTAMSEYAPGVRAFQESLGAGQVGIWFYDDMVADYRGLLSEVLGFLGIAVQGESPDAIPYVNVSGAPRSATVQRAIWWATSHEPVRRTIKSLTSYRLRERTRRNLLRPDSLPGETRIRLHEVFAGDMTELARLIRRSDLPEWLSPTDHPAA